MVIYHWTLIIGFSIAYFAGGMAQIVYRDLKDQGKGKLLGVLWSLGIAIVSCIVVTLLVTLLNQDHTP